MEMDVTDETEVDGTIVLLDRLLSNDIVRLLIDSSWPTELWDDDDTKPCRLTAALVCVYVVCSPIELEFDCTVPTVCETGAVLLEDTVSLLLDQSWLDTVH